MEKVPRNHNVSVGNPSPDRRRGGVHKVERCLIKVVRSKWVASFIVAFAVSWGFHVVEERADQKIEKQQRLTICVIDGVDHAQREPSFLDGGSRVQIRPILQACQERYGK